MKLSDWIGFLAFIIALLILWRFREILLLVFMAVVIAIALNSLVRWLQHRWHLKRGLAVGGALLLVFLGGLVVFVLVFPPFVKQVAELLTVRVPQGMDAIRSFSDNVQDPAWVGQWGDRFPFLKTQQLRDAIDQIQLPEIGDVVNQVSRIIQEVFGNFLTFFSSTAAIALQILLVVILTIMMLSDPTSYRNLLLRLFPSFYRRRADVILTQCEHILLGWMGGVLLSSVFVAIACAIGLWLLKIDLVFAHALLAGLFNIIPNIGPTLSVVFPVSVALIESPGKAIGVVILYLVVQNLESYWFSPMVMRQQVSLLPAATLVAQLFFALFLGPLGLVLALPLTVVSKVWIEEAFIHDILDRWERPYPLVNKDVLAETDKDLALVSRVPSAPSLPQSLPQSSTAQQPEAASQKAGPSDQPLEESSDTDEISLAPDPSLSLPNE